MSFSIIWQERHHFHRPANGIAWRLHVTFADKGANVDCAPTFDEKESAD